MKISFCKEAEVGSLRLVHYGSRKFRREKFHDIQNRVGLNKPIGGLWTSPVDSKWGWRDWCLCESFDTDRLRSRFFLEMDSAAKVLKIDNAEDFKKIPMKSIHQVIRYIDFESLVRFGTDAIWLTERGQVETRFSGRLLENFYGWDCETVLIMNPEIVKEVK